MPRRLDLPIAIVTPWWSAEPAGGAEFLAREIAGQLRDRGHAVEVLTTCGRSAFADWAVDAFEPGAVQENGLTVRRFRLDPRHADRFARHYQALTQGRWLGPAEEREFFAHGINSRALYRFIEEHRERYAFLFIPYLYGTTIYGVRAAAGRAVVIPCLHNEPFAYLAPVAEMMESARGLWFLTEPERDFARTLFAIQHTRAEAIGVGMDFCGRGDGAAFRRRMGIDGPYLLFAGRRVPGKGFGLLQDYFARFRVKHPNWTLVLAGLGGDLPNELPDGVRDIGCLERQTLWNAMAGADVFCQPSLFESFSYVLMEAWVQGTPALVNARCEVTRWQCERAGGGLWFGDEQEFEAALEFYERHPEIARAVGSQGAQYVATHLRWPEIMDRAEALLAE